MVDVAGENTIRPLSAFNRDKPGSATGARTIVLAANEKSLNMYGAICAAAVSSPSQSPVWVESWIRHNNPDVVVAILEEGGAPRLALALEVVNENGCRIARFPGGSHANSNFPATDADFAANADQPNLRELIDEIKRQRPDIDLIKLERQLFECDGAKNPIALLGARESPNIALWADLTGGFEAIADQKSMKRKHKRHRYNRKKFEKHGEIKISRPTEKDEIERCFNFFFEQKAKRFGEAGIKNVFDGPEIQNFFRELFTKSASNGDGRFFLTAIEIGSRLLAVGAETITKARITCEFAAFDAGDGVGGSPGEYLYFENIAKACKAGFDIYDYGVGDETYKRQWCKMEMVQFDTLIPLSAKGHIFAIADNSISALKRLAKRNQRIWNFVKIIRKKLAG